MVVLGAGACRRDEATIALAPLMPEVDAGPELEPIPEGALPCMRDADCDDGVECTRDTCAQDRYCVHPTDDSLCGDGVYCNGQERCDSASGCVAGLPRVCNDDDVCTVDRCDETAKQCTHTPRDFDGDGEGDWHCAGGTDCDDFDPTRSQSVPEICQDGIDNDCDDRIDENGCGNPRHDRCDDALDVSGGGSFMLHVGGAVADYAPRCSPSNSRDVTYAFTLEQVSDVTLTARGLLSDGEEEIAVVAVRTQCGDSATELECGRGFPGEVRMRAVPPGRYFAIVSSALASQVMLEARFDSATPMPANSTCAGALEIDGDTRVTSNFVDVGDDTDLACGFVGANDLFYTFTLDAPRDVEVAAASMTGERMNFAIRRACDDPTTTLRCVSDAPAWARLYQLAAGTYYIVLESSPSKEVDFSLDVAFQEPSAPPPGHGCQSPIDLPLDTEVHGSLSNHQDLVEVQCGCATGDCNMFRPDIVYRVVLAEPGDLGLELDGGNFLFAYDFRTTCDDRDSQLACSQAQVSGGRVRDLPAGTYYLILESAAASNFSLRATALPRSVPVDVSGNDHCGSAAEIPEQGGLFAGDTLSLLNDFEARCGGGAISKDAVYRLTLTTRTEVTAKVDATFDSVLYRYSAGSEGAASCRSATESSCNDDNGQGSTDSALSGEILEPGDYYYVIDGFNTENAGRYTFEVTTVPLGP